MAVKIAPQTAATSRVLAGPLQELAQGSLEVAESLRMLAEIRDIPLHLVKETDEVEKRLDSAFMLLPSLLSLIADGVEARAQPAFYALRTMEAQAGPAPVN